MKTLFLLLTVALLNPVFAFTRHTNTELEIVNPQNRPFAVRLNHQAFTAPAQKQVLRNITSGPQRIQLAYVHHDRGGRISYHVFDHQTIHINPGTKYTAVVNAFDEMILVNTEAIRQFQPVTCYTGNVNPEPLRPLPAVGVHPGQFQQFLAVVKQQSFESTRLDLMHNFITQNALNAQQIKVLMDILQFESSRLKIAILAYQHVVDPGNYFVVHDAFHFESSIRQLNRSLYG